MNMPPEPIRPNFLIIGAPRCGTTSLHDMLGQHPDIFMSAIKEPHFFAGLDFPFPDNEILKITKDPATYQALFAGADDKLCGESSTYYLADPDAPRNIHTYNPDMKLIAVLRNPIERAYSHYLVFDRHGKQPQSFYEMVDEQVRSGGPLARNVVELGKYGSQLERYRQLFPAEQLLVLDFEELTRRPEAALTKILAFLQVDPSYAAQLAANKAKNTYQVPRNKLVAKVLGSKQLIRLGLRVLPRGFGNYVRNNILLKKSKKAPIDERAAALLWQTYQPEMEKLNRLLGSDMHLLPAPTTVNRKEE